MELLAWDKETDTAIEPERAPYDNEWARFPDGTKKQWHKPKEKSEPIPIVIYEISGALFHAPDFSKATCMVGTTVTVKGTVAIPDTIFAMPLKYGNNYEMFAVSVKNGLFAAKISFDKSDQYTYSNEEANLDIEPNTFSVQTIKIDVLKAPVE